MKRLIASVAILFLATPGLYAQAKVDQAKVAAATISVANLEKAVLAFKVKTDKFPAALDDLLDANPPYLTGKDALIDPWGKRYMYDAAGLRNGGKKPDIWTEAPDRRIIGNFPADKK